MMLELSNPVLEDAVRGWYFHDKNFCDFCMIHKNIQPQKFGAIQYANSSVVIMLVTISNFNSCY